MILSAIYGAGDLFILIVGGVFILLGITNIIQYIKTGEMLGGLIFYERLRGRRSALFMGGGFFVLFIIFYVTYLLNYLGAHWR